MLLVNTGGSDNGPLYNCSIKYLRTGESGMVRMEVIAERASFHLMKRIGQHCDNHLPSVLMTLLRTTYTTSHTLRF